MFKSILVICTGNICRSPFGEHVLHRLLPTLKIDSAGVSALVNHEADPTAVKIASKFGISLEGHKGKQFTPLMGRDYDLLLVMDKAHLEQVCKISPEVRGKTMLLGHWLGSREIADPYRKSDEAFELIFELIEQSCSPWAKKLTS